MYYTDIGFKNNDTDNMFFMNILLTSIHTSRHLDFAISFPQFKKGIKTLTKNKNWDNFYAQPGKILRLFSDNKSQLEKFLSLQIIFDFKAKGIIVNTRPIETPIVNKYEYYLREQIDVHIRDVQKRIKSKNFNILINSEIVERNLDFWLKRLKDLEKKKQEEQINVFYIKMYSNSQNTNFSLFIKKETSITNDINFKPNNYGLSQSNNITYLPAFDSNLDL